MRAPKQAYTVCTVALCYFIETDGERVGHTYAKKASERARQRVYFGWGEGGGVALSCCVVFVAELRSNINTALQVGRLLV